MRSQHVPLRSRKPWFRPKFLQGRGVLRARTIRMSRSAFVPGPRSHSRMNVQTDGMMFRKNIGVRLARFRQIDLHKRFQHHDALEFSNGAIVLVTNLAAGQRATVLQLPASPIEERPQAYQPAARYETANV